MDSIPIHLQTGFEEILRKRSVPTGLHLLYKKWLRFYLDFCRKYRFRETERKSLDQFLLKLKGKKQTDAQQKQASHAIKDCYSDAQSAKNGNGDVLAGRVCPAEK